MTTLRRPDHAVRVELSVAFHHCDPLGVVWHGRYFEFLEAARMALMASRGLDPQTVRALGHRMYVTDASCRYMAPFELGQTVRVTAWYSAVSPLIRVAYDLHNPSAGDVWSARAVTVLATTDAQGNLLPATPDAILERLPAR